MVSFANYGSNLFVWDLKPPPAAAGDAGRDPTTDALDEPAAKAQGIPRNVLCPGPPNGVQRVNAFTLSRNGRWLAGLTGAASFVRDNRVLLWDLDAGAGLVGGVPASLRGPQGPVTTLAFTADGRHLVAGSDDSTCRVWPLETLSPTTEPRRLSSGVRTTGGQGRRSGWITADPRWVASIGLDQRTHLYRTTDGDPFRSAILLTPEGRRDRGMFATANFRWLAVADDARAVTLYDLQAADPKAVDVTLDGLASDLTYVRQLLTAGSAGAQAPLLVDAAGGSFALSFLGTAAPGEFRTPWRTRVWRRGPTDRTAREVQAEPIKGRAIGFDPRGRLAMQIDERRLVLWEPSSTAEPLTLFEAPTNRSAALARVWSNPDGARLLALAEWLSTDATPPVYELFSWDLSAADPRPTRCVVQVGGDGGAARLQFTLVPPLVSAGGGRAVDYDVNGVSLLSLTPAGADDQGLFGDAPIDLVKRGDDSSQVVTSVIDPARRWIASSTAKEGMRLWNLDDPEPEPILLAPPYSAASALFSPDGRWLAVLIPDGPAQVWDLHAFNPLKPDVAIARAPKEQVVGLVMGPMGRSIAMADRGGFIHLYRVTADGRTAEPTAELPGHFLPGAPAPSFTVTRDGGYVFSVLDDALLVSTVASKQLVESVAPRAAGRNLTVAEWESLFPRTLKYEPTFPALPVPVRDAPEPLDRAPSR
jgi:WD40 repeat protein